MIREKSVMGKNRQAHEIVEELMAVNGIDEKTLRSYLEDEDFLTEYRRAFTALIEETTREIATKAIRT